MKQVVPCGFYFGCHWYDKGLSILIHLAEAHMHAITSLLIIEGLKLHLYLHSYIPICEQQD